MSLLLAIVMIGMPAALAIPVGRSDFRQMQTTQFCMRCHEMEPSLQVAG